MNKGPPRQARSPFTSRSENGFLQEQLLTKRAINFHGLFRVVANSELPTLRNDGNRETIAKRKQSRSPNCVAFPGSDSPTLPRTCLAGGVRNQNVTFTTPRRHSASLTCPPYA